MHVTCVCVTMTLTQSGLDWMRLRHLTARLSHWSVCVSRSVRRVNHSSRLLAVSNPPTLLPAIVVTCQLARFYIILEPDDRKWIIQLRSGQLCQAHLQIIVSVPLHMFMNFATLSEAHFTFTRMKTFFKDTIHIFAILIKMAGNFLAAN